MTQAQNHADYGQDAPYVVRNLLLSSVIGLIVWAAIHSGIWTGSVSVTLGDKNINFDFTGMAAGIGLICGFLGLWMIWDSRVGKIWGRETLLSHIEWTGSEQVLDLGCGRGLLLIGAAKRLTQGKAVGIDIWQQEDLSGNNAEATLVNARIEGVEDRIELKTADMRALPFPDQFFDVVVSRAAIHNLYHPPDRAIAIAEVFRVLKPGGRAVIEDIRFGVEYSRAFAKAGPVDIRQVGSWLMSAFSMLITMGSLRPVTLIVSKKF
jgi:SAM-dependent methyltransferase